MTSSKQPADGSTIVLTTERLQLRTLTPTHAPFIIELLNQPSFIQNIGDKGVRTIAGACSYIESGPAASYAKHGFGLYLAETKEAGDAIGLCGLLKRENLDDVDIGFAFLPAHWGKGYAIESALAIVAFARATIRLKRLVAIVSPANERSIRVLEKIGMRFERMVRMKDDEPEIRLFGREL